MKQNSPARSLKKEKTSSTGKLWLVRIGLAILALITYGPSVRYGFTLDDETFFTQNILVQQGVSAVGDIFTSSSLPGSSELTTNHPFRSFGYRNYKSIQTVATDVNIRCND